MFQLQNDRNMVIYAGTEAIWASKTYFNPNAPCVPYPLSLPSRLLSHLLRSLRH